MASSVCEALAELTPSCLRAVGTVQVYREALQPDVIAHAGQEEARWALFAAVKIGDVSVMPLAVPVLVALRHARGWRCERGETLNACEASGRIGVRESGAKVCFDLRGELAADAWSQTRRHAERSFTIVEQFQRLAISCSPPF